MRELKFRAWDGKEILQWNGIGDEHGDLQTRMLANVFNDVSLRFIQYTGLKDKNGVEIYEGDIISVSTNADGIFKVAVEFYKGAFGFMNMYCQCVANPKNWSKDHNKVNSGWFFGGFSNLSGDGYSKCEEADVYGKSECIEVIGNIYENPELLEK